MITPSPDRSLYPPTATPTLSATHQSTGVIPSAITQTLTVNIPAVLGVEGHSGTTIDAMVGQETTYAINISNTGNNMTSYRLSHDRFTPSRMGCFLLNLQLDANNDRDLGSGKRLKPPRQ